MPFQGPVTHTFLLWKQLAWPLEEGGIYKVTKTQRGTVSCPSLPPPYVRMRAETGLSNRSVVGWGGVGWGCQIYQMENQMPNYIWISGEQIIFIFIYFLKILFIYSWETHRSQSYTKSWGSAMDIFMILFPLLVFNKSHEKGNILLQNRLQRDGFA